MCPRSFTAGSVSFPWHLYIPWGSWNSVGQLLPGHCPVRLDFALEWKMLSLSYCINDQGTEWVTEGLSAPLRSHGRETNFYLLVCTMLPPNSGLFLSLSLVLVP